MMDASLAKGLTKRFLEEYHEQALKKVKQFRPSIAAFSSRKSWSRFVDNFSSSRNTWAVHAAEYGTRRKPNLGFLTLAEPISMPSKTGKINAQVYKVDVSSPRARHRS